MKNFGLSDKGMIRSNNQDAYCHRICNGFGFSVVCDGMGGAAAGHKASSIAAKNICDSIEANVKKNLSLADVKSMLRNIVRSANATLNDLSRSQKEYAGMGTTAVIMLYMEAQNKAVFVNVGDSRAYLVRKTEIIQITVDHSLVQEMVNNGQLTKEQASIHPNKNIITKALGPDKEIHPDTFEAEVQIGDIILLCTDGLCNMLTDAQILDVIYANQKSLSEAASELINQANLKGGTDNITVVLSYIE